MQDITSENKLRLLMVYAASYGEKLERSKIRKLAEVGPFLLLLLFCNITVIPSEFWIVIKTVTLQEDVSCTQQ